MEEIEILKCKNICKKFGNISALIDINLSVFKGEIFGLVGPNGAGKTTLVNILTGVYPQDSGTLLFKDVDLRKVKPHEITKFGISRTFQLVKPFLGLSPLENVIVGISYGRKKTKSDSKNYNFVAIQILERVGIKKEHFKVPVKKLDLFDWKKVELARALSTNPELLLLDEPLAGLDIKESEAFLEQIKQLPKNGITVLIIEHAIDAIMSIANRVMVIDSGIKVCEGKPADIIHDKKFRKCYFGEECA